MSNMVRISYRRQFANDIVLSIVNHTMYIVCMGVLYHP